MVVFIKPGPINGMEDRTEYGCGPAGVLAQSPLHPLPEHAVFAKNFRSIEKFGKGLTHQTDYRYARSGHEQQFKKFPEARSSSETMEGLDDRICANMTNKEFVQEFDEIRGKLIKVLTGSVIPSVSQWGPATRDRAIKWFGTDSEKLRLILSNGYPKCVAVLKQMSGENFVKPTTGYLFGCPPNPNEKGVHAAVCPIDGGHHIAIYPNYCDSRTYSSQQSSKIGTILHEVCHFETTFTSQDHAYDEVLSERLARTDPARTLSNTDSFVMFALHGVVYGTL